MKIKKKDLIIIKNLKLAKFNETKKMRLILYQEGLNDIVEI